MRLALGALLAIVATVLINYSNYLMKRELGNLPRIGSESALRTIRAFLNCRPWLKAQGIQAEYAEKLLTAFGVWGYGSMGESAIPPHSHTQSLPDPLTPRELDVLHCISQGLSNQDIAEKLVIALNTVKRHTSSIYGKLSVKSRTQAVARARELGLLPTDQK